MKFGKATLAAKDAKAREGMLVKRKDLMTEPRQTVPHPGNRALSAL